MAADVTMDSLLDQTVDLDRLTRWPTPSYVTSQFSSYDRKSKSPDEEWFANVDRGEFIRMEEVDGRKEHVMMDIAGPGAIVRIWSANPGGVIRIYLDKNDKPAIAVKMSDLLGGSFPNMPKPFAGQRAAGWTLWFPIPYAKHCKVTTTADDIYYLINYRTYPENVSVKTFSEEDLTNSKDKIRTLADELASPQQVGRYTKMKRSRGVFGAKKTLQPDDTFKAPLAPGPAQVGHVLVKLKADDYDKAARGVILKMRFDGQETVACPLGDFFGAAPGFLPFESITVGMEERQGDRVMWSHWRMPYRKSAEFEFVNWSGQEATVDFEFGCAAYEWSDDSLLFHAKWRTEKELPTRPFVDWRHLQCEGPGRFVGGTLHFINPVKMWWGEGDEKIYVDGEKFPSHFGTGTEDYYSYAWGSPEVFTHAYHSQPVCDGPGTYGNTSLNRFHILDDIPFKESFVFDMENWHWTTDIKVTRAATSYWYARPGTKDFYKPLTREAVQLVEVPPFGTPGVMEGEDLHVVERDGGAGPLENDHRYSAEEYMRWHPDEIGDRLTFGLQIKEAGKKKVTVRLAKSWDFGIAQLYINDEKAGEPIDMYVEGGGPSDDIVLGTFDLEKGQNTLTMEVVGKNEASKGLIGGLDYVRIEDVED
jgi:hypothetical protein